MQIAQGLTEQFTDFLQRLSWVVELQVADSDSRKILIPSLAYENAN